MRIDWDTPVDVLIHSDDVGYIDLDEGELMHWKYIKREKRPNGKWRYYYDIKDALGYDERERLQKAEEAKTKADDAERRTWDWTMDMLGKYGDYSRAGASKESINRVKEGMITASKFHDEAVREQESAGRKYLNAKNAFMRTPLGKVTSARNKIATGLEKVAKWIRG